MHTFIIFSLHLLGYWAMVYVYDKKDTADFNIAVKNSLRNQLFLTLPATYLFLQYYPINYTDFLISVAYLPILIISGDVYFYLSHRPLHTKYF